MHPSRLAATLSCALAALLSACGGGGGSSPPAPPSSPSPTSLPAVDTRAVAMADPGSTLPEGWMHGGLLQVYVRAYQDSNGDGIGDLRGLIQRLPYIQQLGVAGLWLMPITRSQDRDHGYAVTDYREIETDYGTLANHDSFAGDRLWNQFGGNNGQMKLAAALLLLGPGVPFIYYGEVIGMARAPSLGGDAGLRTPMSWTADTTRAGFSTGTAFRALAGNVATLNVAAQETDPNSLLAHYRGLLALRKAAPALARGSTADVAASGALLRWRRDAGGTDQVLVAVNAGGSAASVTHSGLAPGSCFVVVWPLADPAPACADAVGRLTQAVAAGTAVAWRRSP